MLAVGTLGTAQRPARQAGASSAAAHAALRTCSGGGQAHRLHCLLGPTRDGAWSRRLEGPPAVAFEPALVADQRESGAAGARAAALSAALHREGADRGGGCSDVAASEDDAGEDEGGGRRRACRAASGWRGRR